MIIYESTFLLIYSLFIAFILGAVFGSFLNCLAYRVAHHSSVLKGRSECPSCHHTLGILDLVPIFSWLCLKGRCRYCKEKISIRYPLTELFMGVMSVLCLLHYDISFNYIKAFIVLCVLFTLSLVDLEIYEIPDSCHVILLLVWGISLYFEPSPLTTLKSSLISGVVVGGMVLVISLIVEKILQKEAMGGGDIKLLFVAGVYLGLVGSLFMIFLACIIGLLFSFIKINEEGQIPFGPAISISFMLMMLYGGGFINWYMSLF